MLSPFFRSVPPRPRVQPRPPRPRQLPEAPPTNLCPSLGLSVSPATGWQRAARSRLGTTKHFAKLRRLKVSTPGDGQRRPWNSLAVTRVQPQPCSLTADKRPSHCHSDSRSPGRVPTTLPLPPHCQPRLCSDSAPSLFIKIYLFDSHMDRGKEREGLPCGWQGPRSPGHRAVPALVQELVGSGRALADRSTRRHVARVASPRLPLTDGRSERLLQPPSTVGWELSSLGAGSQYWANFPTEKRDYECEGFPPAPGR